MSSAFRVELPAYSHSFEVQVNAASTIRDVKQEIAKVCPGSPSPAGQRLIWRGRFLKDEENVEDIWKSPDDSRVIHLAVHPSAWTSAPPTLPAAPTIATFASQPTATPTQPRASAGQSAPSPSWYPPLPQLSNPYLNASPIPPIAYIHHLHNQALAIISAGAITSPSQPNSTDLEAWRSAAKDFYRVRGWPWPDIYDAPYPSGTAEQGVVYEPVTLEGLPYLKLATPGATPTPAQLHAIRVLSQTFSILSIPNDLLYYPPVNQYPPPPYATATDVNEHLRRLGLPALRFIHTPGAPPNPNDPNNHNPLAAPGAAGAELRAVPVRALMVPLLMLAFRTLLLLYFFSPSKRPLFGMILSLWILYEAWTAMRLVLHDGNERGADGAANPAAPNAPAGAGQPAAEAARLAGLNMNGAAPNAAVGQSAAILDRLAVVNIAAEDALLETEAPHPSPSFGLKARMFVLLFFASLHPAAWDRRRTALRRREGRIRTEANARQAALSERSDQAQDGAEQEDERQQRSEEDARARAREQMVLRHERRPAWLKAYVQRVQYTEWADDP